MADRALDYLAGVALKRLGCHIVIGGIVNDGLLGVGAAMSVIAGNLSLNAAICQQRFYTPNLDTAGKKNQHDSSKGLTAATK
jgi:hypothetical protein